MSGALGLPHEDCQDSPAQQSWCDKGAATTDSAYTSAGPSGSRHERTFNFTSSPADGRILRLIVFVRIPGISEG